MLKGLIIDDEINGAELLQFLITDNCPEISIIAIETSAEKGIELIRKHKPDVIFLDIQMPEMSGFQLLEKVKEFSFHVIFTTAFDHHALNAFKYNTVDYLLKPIIVDELIRAVDKLKARVNAQPAGMDISKMLDTLKGAQNTGKIAISSQNEIIYVEAGKINRLESDSNYTIFILTDGKKITSSKTLKEYESVLNPSFFFRTHKTFIVNLDQVEKFVKSEGGYIVMKDNKQIPVSRERRQDVINALATR